jgi:hypothetical protein
MPGPKPKPKAPPTKRLSNQRGAHDTPGTRGGRSGSATSPYYEADLRVLRDALDHPDYEIHRETLAVSMVAGMTASASLAAAGFPIGKRGIEIDKTLHHIIVTHEVVGKRMRELSLVRSTMVLRESAKMIADGGLSADMVLGGLMRIAAVCMEPATFQPTAARMALRDLGDHLGLFKDSHAPPPIDPKLMDFVLRISKMDETTLDRLISAVASDGALDISPSVVQNGAVQNGHAIEQSFDHLPPHARPPARH